VSSEDVERIEESRYVRTHLLRRIAHEIVSPIGVAWGALEEVEAGADASLRGSVPMVRRGLLRLRRLANRLSLTAELESGAHVERVRVDLGELVKRTVAEVSELDGRRSVSITVDVPPEPVVVQGDGRWLGAAVTEVIGNALRHARSKARVVIQATRDEGGDVTVVVEDDGAGFAADPDTLMDRFHLRESVHGLGLSLALARDAVRAHGGQLTFGASTLPPGRAGSTPGAAVTIRLPRSQSEAALG
jgi:signal transduction histidine kinase